MSEEKQNPSKKTIEDLLNMLAIGEQPTASQRKTMEEYKFWKTQPVSKFDERIIEEGPINPEKTPEDVSKEPYTLHSSFEWVTLNVDDKNDLDALHGLLYEHYVEDHDATFRFAYTHDFFNWALKPPGWKSDWHLGVRAKDSKKLVGFICGVPCSLDVRGKVVPSVEINFLCVHKQLRSKRLAPLLIKEVTRRINLCNIWQALYTSGTVLPSPVSVCRYTHRPLNWEKLYEVGFSSLPEGTSKASMIAKHALINETKTKGWRKMQHKDVEKVWQLYESWTKRYDLGQIMDKNEIEHWLFGGENQDSKVVHTFVVESEADGKITDFISFYDLPFTVLQNADYDKLGVGYLYYYATDIALGKDRRDKEFDPILKKRLCSLVSDAMIEAKKLGMDVFNALTCQDNVLFLDELKFGLGDGFLNYYLFNYKAFPVSGGTVEGTDEYDLVNKSGVGVVML